MNINKNYLIYALSLIVSILIGYIVIQEPHVEVVTKTKIKTIVKEKIVYQNNKECNEKKPTKEIITSLHDIKTTEKKENIISTSTDNRHRFTISLLSNEKINTSDSFKNIILNGTLKSESYQSIFILDIDQAILKQNNIFFKIEDSYHKMIIQGDATCLQDILEGFIYKVELEIIDNNINCMVFQDRKIKENDKYTIQPKEQTVPKFKLMEEVKKDINEEDLEKKLEFQKTLNDFFEKR